MKRNFNEIVGIVEVENELLSKGVKITDVDKSIADALMSLTQETAIRGYEDEDGIISRPVRGFIKSEQVVTLLKQFPSVVALIMQLDEKNNYGFVDAEGNVKRVGLMGDNNPIMDLKDMVTAYVEQNSKIPLYSSREEYDEKTRAKNDSEFNQRLQQSYGDLLGKPMENFNIYSAGTPGIEAAVEDDDEIKFIK